MGIRLVKYGLTNGTGTYNHDELFNRDLPDQHPISAITGLEDRLKQIDINIEKASGIDETINTKSLTLEYDKENKTLTGNVNIFVSEDNALVEKTSGLYVDKYLDIETEDTNTIHLTVEGKGETLETMYNSGTRFSHNGSVNNIANQSEANAWYYDSDLLSFVQPQNTTTFTGFVSTVRYRTYTHRARLTSTGSDNDGIGLVIAYVTDEEGVPHTLSVIVNKGGEGHVGGYYYALVYNKSLPGQEVLFRKGNRENGTIPGNHTTGNWNGASITVEVNKVGAIITCATSDYNSTEINQDTLIEIDLDNYEWGHLFRGKVQYGYCAQSQASSYYQDIYFYGKGPLKGYAILSPNINNALEAREDGLYVSKNLTSGAGSKTIFTSTSFDNSLAVGEIVYYNSASKMYERVNASYNAKTIGIVYSIEDGTIYIQTDGIYETNYFIDNSIPPSTNIYLSNIGSAFSTDKTDYYLGYVVDSGLALGIKDPIEYENLTQPEIEVILGKCFN